MISCIVIDNLSKLYDFIDFGRKSHIFYLFFLGETFSAGPARQAFSEKSLRKAFTKNYLSKPFE